MEICTARTMDNINATAGPIMTGPVTQIAALLTFIVSIRSDATVLENVTTLL